jgi:NAD+ synthase (glutamine-hydrolysing)
MLFKVCLAQLNFVVGDVQGNARRIIQAAHEAHAQGAQMVVTPELALCGYAAEDLFLRPAFLDACDDALALVCRETAHLNGLTVVVGHPQRHDLLSQAPDGWAGEASGGVRGRSVSVTCLHNAASVVQSGKVVHTYAKQMWPNYQVFDERRYFTPGDRTLVFDVPAPTAAACDAVC